jgi:L-amino acid N-acyltransferase YncA
MKNIQIFPINKKYVNEFIKTFTGSYFDDEKEAKNHFNEKLKEKRLYLLFDRKELIGFFDYIYQYSHNANYLYNLCIADKFRRKGYSKYLLKKYIEISKEQKTRNKFALSSTHRTNVRSQKMHLSFGFKKMGVLKGLHYGEDEIFYSYDLE